MQTTIELTKEDFWHPIPILFDTVNTLYMTKNKILKICRPREGGDPCSQRHHATPKMDSRLRGKDNIIFVMYKETTP